MLCSISLAHTEGRPSTRCVLVPITVRTRRDEGLTLITFGRIVIGTGSPDYDPRTIYIPKGAWSKFTPFETQVGPGSLVLYV